MTGLSKKNNARWLSLSKPPYLQLILFALVAIFFASMWARPGQRAFQTAFLNPKNIGRVDQVRLSYAGEGEVLLKKCGSFWAGQSQLKDGNSIYFCADSILVKKMLDTASGVFSAYEVSSSKKEEKSFGLSQQDAFFIEFAIENKILSQISFGNVDSLGRIFFCTDKQSKIYCASTGLSSYLNATAGFWCAPEIFPASICDRNEPQPLLKYRHGSLLPSIANDFDWAGAKEVSLDPGDGNFYKALFIPSGASQGDWYGRFVAAPSAQRSREEKEQMEKFNYVFSVSAWTMTQMQENK